MELNINVLIMFSLLSFVIGNPLTKYTDETESDRFSQYDASIEENDNGKPIILEPIESYPDVVSPLHNKEIPKTQEYSDFIKELYRFDKTKEQEVEELVKNVDNVNAHHFNKRSIGEDNLSNNLPRKKRVIVFRPVFSYRQQTVKKQRVPASNYRPNQNSIEQSDSQIPKRNTNNNKNSNKNYNTDLNAYRYSQRYPYYNNYN